MKLAGKSALVTGSSSGIGAAIAVRLAEEGADKAITEKELRPLTPLSPPVHTPD